MLTIMYFSTFSQPTCCIAPTWIVVLFSLLGRESCQSKPWVHIVGHKYGCLVRKQQRKHILQTTYQIQTNRPTILEILVRNGLFTSARVNTRITTAVQLMVSLFVHEPNPPKKIKKINRTGTVRNWPS